MVAQIASHDAMYEVFSDNRRWPTLVCPHDGRSVQENTAQLCCPQGHRFEVRNGAVIFAEPARYPGLPAPLLQYLYEIQWDSRTHAPIHRRMLETCIGDSNWYRLEGEPVLVVGCNTGRFSEVLQARGACVTNVECPSLLTWPPSKTTITDNNRLIYAHPDALPFSVHQYALVICIDTLSFVQRPERVLRRLYQQLRPGGLMVFDMELFRPLSVNFSRALLHQLLSRVPPEIAWRLNKAVVRTLLPAHRALNHFSIGHTLLERLSPLRDCHVQHHALSQAVQQAWTSLNTFQALTAAHRHSKPAQHIMRAIHHLGGQVVHQHAAGGRALWTIERLA